MGKAEAVVTQAFELKANSRDFVEELTVEVQSASGRAAGASLTLSASCGGTCKAGEKFPRTILRAGQQANTTITYHDSTTSHHTTRTSYALTASKAGSPQASSRWKSPVYRCDQEIGRSAGCVFPKVRPVLTSMGALPQIAKNIRRVQDAGPHHYGDRARGNPAHPLHQCPRGARQPQQGMSRIPQTAPGHELRRVPLRPQQPRRFPLPT
ncbi:hypothetical protein [Streptomyces sp. NPDC058644]|uniref:hypothetical protein n=1 Tax=unclassified Streptomyces TaxID=2593676 RepID=UPI00365FA3EC